MTVQSRGPLARVVAIENGVAHLSLVNGGRATVSPVDPNTIAIGDIFYVDEGADRIDRAPAEVWPEATRLGVVQYLHESHVVLHADHQSVMVSPPSFEVRVGNTVKFGEVAGILAIVSETPLPIPSLDIDELVDVSKYRVSLDDIDDVIDDFIGSESTKRRVRHVVDLPLERPELFTAIGAGAITGALFYGPPGTGKTMLARIIAKKANVPLFVVRGPEVDSKYVGTAERTLRTIFESAKSLPRAIIVLDELDAIAPARGANVHRSDNKIVATLLALMDGVVSKGDIFVIGTTNLPESLDTALLRSSRFHWQIEFPLLDEAQRLRLLERAASTIRIGKRVDLARLAAGTHGWSGDDINGIWREAQVLAVSDGRASINSEDAFEGLARLEKQRQNRQMNGGARRDV